MSLIIILICLLSERFFWEQQSLRRTGWFSDYSLWYQRQELPDWMNRGFWGVILLLLPPLLGVALLQELLDGILFGIPAVLFAGLVLFFSLGPTDLDRQVSDYAAARERGQDGEALDLAREILNDEPPPGEPTCSQAVAERVLDQANSHLFAVIFWFLLLGPMGALFYRTANLLSSLQAVDKGSDLYFTSRRLIAILDWLPARLTAFSYAIAGSFEDALIGWRSYHENRFNEFADSASGILICTGGGAMRLDTLLESQTEETPTEAFYLAKAAMGLVWRALVVWVVILGFLTLAGWL